MNSPLLELGAKNLSGKAFRFGIFPTDYVSANAKEAFDWQRKLADRAEAGLAR
jgi:hypothetical protein